ncbi:unnamed protein product [Ambrosiozyma monospora]|uniref:Unnamed protein product n=1 Tax=Ambrosiozyma monospora TaxID=43982 RepID=A0ACB5TWJ4_AMBMO|nr:unnamed protein product [Ambrosiozyma monospora]
MLLAKIQKEHPNLRSYQEIGIAAYGEKAGVLIFAVFGIDLFGAAVIMVLLFSDSFSTIFDEVSPFYFKLFICSLLLLLNFLPLRILSISSFMGIVCTTITFLVIFIAGLVKTDSPGSLNSPMPTNLWPESWMDLFFSFGLFLAPWGGHAAFPEIYMDQVHPESYETCMNTAFSFSYTIDLATGCVGFLMFGFLIDDEVTKNILTTPGYPSWIAKAIILMMGLLPISKLPLACRPIITAVDGFTSAHHSMLRQSLNKVAISAVIFGVSVLVTSFGKVMALQGASICFTVCITFPVLFYISIFDKQLSYKDNTMLYSVVAVSVLCSVLGAAAVLVK